MRNARVDETSVERNVAAADFLWAAESSFDK
jgi:hypothetical protein